MKAKSNRSENMMRDKMISDYFWILSMQNTIEERKPSRELDKLPYLGY